MRQFAAEGRTGAVYPRYRLQEEIADRCIHFLGLGLGSGAALVLIGLAAGDGEARTVIAVAFYASSRPTNVYVAFPDVDYQVEVYDPQALKARSRVASGRVVRVG